MEGNMGLFCVSFHFKTANVGALAAALDRRKVRDRRLLPVHNGWCSLYEEKASQQDDARIRKLASGLSKDLQVPAIAFMVHDSDIACYWLYDNGVLLDEYNSCPDYFDNDGDGESTPSGGDAEVLVRFCRPGVSVEQLSEVLSTNVVFAEEIIQRLADALGIEIGRALADYRDSADGEGPDDEEESDDDGSGPRSSVPLPGNLAAMFGLASPTAAADPQAAALVAAAAAGDVAELDRLIAAGTPVDVEAPESLPASPMSAGISKLLPNGMPKVPMTPLLAAVLHKQLPVVDRLLKAGADPNHSHAQGTAVHAAAALGEVELLQLLIDHKGDVNGRDARGQTPLAAIEGARMALERVAEVQKMMASMKLKMPGIAEAMANVKLPTAGWDACERLLKAHGATE
jgi:hypothetical protein